MIEIRIRKTAVFNAVSQHNKFTTRFISVKSLKKRLHKKSSIVISFQIEIMKASCRPMTHRPTDQVKVTVAVTAKSMFTSELIVEFDWNKFNLDPWKKVWSLFSSPLWTMII